MDEEDLDLHHVALRESVEEWAEMMKRAGEKGRE